MNNITSERDDLFTIDSTEELKLNSKFEDISCVIGKRGLTNTKCVLANAVSAEKHVCANAVLH